MTGRFDEGIVPIFAPESTVVAGLLHQENKRLRAALEKIGAMSCVMGYDSGHAGVYAIVREALRGADETTGDV